MPEQKDPKTCFRGVQKTDWVGLIRTRFLSQIADERLIILLFLWALFGFIIVLWTKYEEAKKDISASKKSNEGFNSMYLDSNGKFKTYHGNSLISFVDEGETKIKLWTLYEALQQSRLADFYTLLPPSSYHVTICPGVGPLMVNEMDSITGDMYMKGKDVLSEMKFLRPRFRVKQLCTTGGFLALALEQGDEVSLGKYKEALMEIWNIRKEDSLEKDFLLILGYQYKFIPENLRTLPDGLEDILPRGMLTDCFKYPQLCTCAHLKEFVPYNM